MKKIHVKNSTPPKIISNGYKNNNFVQFKSNKASTNLNNNNIALQSEPNRYYDTFYPANHSKLKTNHQTDVWNKVHFQQQDLKYKRDPHEDSQTLQMLKLIYIQIFSQLKYQNDYKKFYKIQTKNFANSLIDNVDAQSEQQQFNIEGMLLQNIIKQIQRLKNQRQFQSIYDNRQKDLYQKLNPNQTSVPKLNCSSAKDYKLSTVTRQNQILKQKIQEISQQLQTLKEQINTLSEQKERLTHLNQCKFKKIQQLKKDIAYCNDYIDQKQVQMSQLIQENSKLQTTLKIVEGDHNKTVLVMKNLEQSVLQGKIQNQNQLQEKFTIQGYLWALEQIDNQIKRLKLQNIEIEGKKKSEDVEIAVHKSRTDILQQDMNILTGPNCHQLFSKLKSHTLQFDNQQQSISKKQYFQDFN